MINWLQDRLRSLRRPEAKMSAEVEHIRALQQAAIQRRAEYAAELERASGTDAETPSRRKVEEAEAAHAAALQAWDDKEFRRRAG